MVSGLITSAQFLMWISESASHRAPKQTVRFGAFYSRERVSEEIAKKEHLEVLDHLIRSVDRTGASQSQ